jgi:hypothetical protein
MKQTETEVTGKVFVVVEKKRQCLICDGVFTPRDAAKHGGAICHPSKKGSSTNGGTMQIGEPLRTIVVEPLELPVNDPQTRPEPEPAPQPEPEPEQVPAKR